MFNKFKPFLANDVFFYASLLLFIGFSSFALGRLSLAVERNQSDGGVSYTEKPAPVHDLANSPVVVSKNGSKYHYLWCPGATQMKDENRVEFANATLAEAAGYELATNCE